MHAVAAIVSHRFAAKAEILAPSDQLRPRQLRANVYFLWADFGDVVDVMKRQFPMCRQGDWSALLSGSATMSYPRGTMTARMWENISKVALDLKIITRSLPPMEEGDFVGQTSAS